MLHAPRNAYAFCSEEEGSYKTCRRICDELEVPNHGSNDYEVMRQVCHHVSQRSAAIVAAGECGAILLLVHKLHSSILAISALLRHINRQTIKIGVGGALIQFHPTYHELLKAQLDLLAPLNVEVKLCVRVATLQQRVYSGSSCPPTKEARKERRSSLRSPKSSTSKSKLIFLTQRTLVLFFFNDFYLSF